MMIGVDLGGTNARAGLVHKGKIIRSSQIKLTEKQSEQNILDQLYSIISPLIESEVEGIGIGVPSIVDTEQGIVYDVVNIPAWKEVPVKRLFEEKFGVPVFVNNDVNCMALGEQMFGQGTQFSSFVALVIGTGLGSALVLDKKLYTGIHCGAGEIGYIPYLDSNLEYYASGSFFEGNNTTALAEYEAALRGEAKALDMWAAYGGHLGEAIKVVMYAYAPEGIIIGGGLAAAFPLFKDAMYRSMQNFLFQNTLKDVKIVPSLVENIALMGAAALVNLHRS